MSSMTVKGYLSDIEGVVYPSFDVLHPKLLQTYTTVTTDEYWVPDFSPILDQFDIGSCVLNAWCGLLEMLRALEQSLAGQIPNPELLSRLMAYWLCREQMGTLDQDSGTTPSLGADRLMKIGVIPESMWPYEDALLTKKPDHGLVDMYKVADDNKLTAIGRITSSSTKRLDDWEASIRLNHPVVFGGPVGQQIRTATPGDVLTIPGGTGNPVIGGHCMLAARVRKLNNGRRQYGARNSWGKDYADGGYVWLDEDYVMWPQLGDCWTGTKMDPLLL